MDNTTLEKLDILTNYITDLYYEFGENSQFFKGINSNLTPRQLDLLRKLFDWNYYDFQKLINDLNFNGKLELEELEEELELIQDRNAALEDENEDLQEKVDELQSRIDELEEEIDSLKS